MLCKGSIHDEFLYVENTKNRCIGMNLIICSDIAVKNVKGSSPS